jgi:hypothetical protein
MVVGRHGIRAAKTRDEIETRNPARKRGWKLCLGDCRRRVLEDARSGEGRGDPDRVQRRDERKLKSRGRSYDQGCRRCVLIIARCDKSDRAFMLSLFCLWVQPLVPLRQNAQRHPGKKGGADPPGDDATNERECQRPVHWFAGSLDHAVKATTFSLQSRVGL